MSRTPEAVAERVRKVFAVSKRLPNAPYSVIAREAGVSRHMAMAYLRGTCKAAYQMKESYARK